MITALIFVLLFVVLAAASVSAGVTHAVEGYEDDAGFHFGKPRREGLTKLFSEKSPWACLEKVDTNSGSFDVLCFLLVFEHHRGDLTQRAVAPRWVIKRLDIIEDGKLGVAAAGGN